jgi:hypothetical protein
MVFHSKRDRSIVVMRMMTIFIVAGASLVGLLATDKSFVLRIPIGILLLFGSMYLLFGLVNTRYKIQGNTLYIGDGIYDTKVDIHSIRRIQTTNDILTSHALSTDRIELFFGESKSILISPKKKKEFIDALLTVNPTIQLP